MCILYLFRENLKCKDRHATDETTFYANVGKSKYFFISLLHESSGKKKFKKIGISNFQNYLKYFQKNAPSCSYVILGDPMVILW